METRKLGKNGPQVPVLCLGGAPLAGGHGAVQEEQAIATIHAALDAGVTFIDTAEAYRSSETLVGKALKGRRDKVFIATKLSKSHALDHMQVAIENSLRALQTDYVDVYQLHDPLPQFPIEQTMEGLVRLKEQGKIRYIGVCNFTAEETAAAMKVAHVDSNQPLYNMLVRLAEESILPFCQKNGVGVIVHSPLATGMLTGKYTPGHQFGQDDERRRITAFRDERFPKTLAVVEKLKRWAEARGHTLPQLAIAWTLAHPAVTSSIFGAKSRQQVQDNAKAAGWTLTPAELKELNQVQGGYRLPHYRMEKRLPA